MSLPIEVVVRLTGVPLRKLEQDMRRGRLRGTEPEDVRAYMRAQFESERTRRVEAQLRAEGWTPPARSRLERIRGKFRKDRF